jgi:hypothetical protein
LRRSAPLIIINISLQNECMIYMRLGTNIPKIFLFN